MWQNCRLRSARDARSHFWVDDSRQLCIAKSCSCFISRTTQTPGLGHTTPQLDPIRASIWGSRRGLLLCVRDARKDQLTFDASFNFETSSLTDKTQQCIELLYRVIEGLRTCDPVVG